MHCLNAVMDDLHDYAEAIQRRMFDLAKSDAIDFLRVGNFDCEVLHRKGRLQTELVEIKPGAVVPQHCHPGVDSVDFLLRGNVAGFDIAGRHLKRFVQGMGLRIAQDAYHGGRAGPEGVAFLSCQRWQEAPTFIAKAWRGEPVNDRHARMLDALEAVA